MTTTKGKNKNEEVKVKKLSFKLATDNGYITQEVAHEEEIVFYDESDSASIDEVCRFEWATGDGKITKEVANEEESAFSDESYPSNFPESKLEEASDSYARRTLIAHVVEAGKAYMKRRRQVKDSGATWENLKTIEKRRRAILRRTELPLYRTLLFWDGTCLLLLVEEGLFWITVLVYVLARLFLPKDFSDVINSGDIAIVGGFLSFFLVFFVVQSNERYTKLYGTSMEMEGLIHNIASLSRGELPTERGQRLLRYMNAAHVAAYVGLSDTYTKNNFFNPINKSWKLLTDREHERMVELNMDGGGSCYRELIAWSLLEIRDAGTSKVLDDYTACIMRGYILDFRGCIKTLYDFDDQPVSFFYVHFIMLLSSLYLPIFALSIAAGAVEANSWLADMVSGLIVFLQALFVIGLRILGQKLSDPYGEDLEDLSVMQYVNVACRASQRIMAAETPPPLDAFVEGNLSRTTVEALGKARKTTTATAPVTTTAPRRGLRKDRSEYFNKM